MEDNENIRKDEIDVEVNLLQSMIFYMFATEPESNRNFDKIVEYLEIGSDFEYNINAFPEDHPGRRLYSEIKNKLEEDVSIYKKLSTIVRDFAEKYSFDTNLHSLVEVENYAKRIVSEEL